MALYQLRAVFRDERAALDARHQLLMSGAQEGTLRISADVVLNAELDSVDAADAARAVVQEAGALEAHYTVSEDASNWMGHITDRVTSTKVEPGQGDAEAGPDFRGDRL